MSTVSGLFGSKKTVSAPPAAKLVKALPPTAVRRPLSPIPEEKEEKKTPVTKGKKTSTSAEPSTTKKALVEKVKAVVKEAVHDAVSDSDTESYYDDVDNLSGSDEPEFDEDGDPSKRTMARAVKKVGSKNVELNAKLKKLEDQLSAATSMIAAPNFAFAQDKGLVGIAMPTKSSSRWISDGESMVKQFTDAGYATDLPATFMYTMAFSRGQIGLGAASATVMLATVAAIVVPYLYSELRAKR